MSNSTLSYKAATYASNATPIALHDYQLTLAKQPDGSFGIGGNKILVKVHSTSLNPVDVLLYTVAPAFLSRFTKHQGIGRDYLGTVVSIGPDAAKKTGLAVGDEVSGMYTHPFGPGTISEYITLDLDQKTDVSITKKPANLSLEEAAAWPLVYGTAHEILQKAQSVAGKRVLVLGAGTSVGRLVVQLAYLDGAAEVVTTNSASSADVVREFGVSTYIDYTKHKSILQPTLEIVKEAGTFDLIVDTVGNGDLISNLGHILAKGGDYVTIVGDSKYDYDHISLFTVIWNSVKLAPRFVGNFLGTNGYNYIFVMTKPGAKWPLKGKHLIEENKISVAIDGVYPLEELDEAFNKVRSSKARGKVVVRVVS